MTLYQLTEEYIQLKEWAEDEDIDPQMIKDAMDDNTDEIKDKVQSYGCVIKDLESDSDALAKEIARLQAKKRTIDNNVASMKRSLQMVMVETGMRKIPTPLFTFSVQPNPPSVHILDADIVPEIFMVPQEPKADKKAMLEYLKTNGSQEWGEIVQTESLRIR